MGCCNWWDTGWWNWWHTAWCSWWHTGWCNRWHTGWGNWWHTGLCGCWCTACIIATGYRWSLSVTREFPMWFRYLCTIRSPSSGDDVYGEKGSQCPLQCVLRRREEIVSDYKWNWYFIYQYADTPPHTVTHDHGLIVIYQPTRVY